MNADQIGEIKEKINELLNKENGEFTHNITLSEDPELLFIYNAIKKNDNKWEKNKYAVDVNITVKIDDPEQWDNVNDEINNMERKIRDMNYNSLGLSSPVVMRKNTEVDVKKWNRRIIKDK